MEEQSLNELAKTITKGMAQDTLILQAISKINKDNYHVYFVATHSKLNIFELLHNIEKGIDNIVDSLIPYMYCCYLDNIDNFVSHDIQDIVINYYAEFNVRSIFDNNNEVEEYKPISINYPDKQYYKDIHKQIKEEKNVYIHPGIIKLCYIFFDKEAQREEFGVIELFEAKRMLVEKYGDFLAPKFKKKILDELYDFTEEDYYTDEYKSMIESEKRGYDEWHEKTHWHDDTWDAMTNGDYEDYMGSDNFDWML